MLTLDQAQAIVAGALAEARLANAKPLAIVVLDAGGHLVALAREDRASLYRAEIARGKASGALGMGSDSRAIAERAADNPNFFASVAALVPGGLVLSGGGILIRSNGNVIGAVGISGDTADIDEQCALAGISAAGLDRKDPA